MSEALRGPAATFPPAVLWPLALVASVHLLTTPGQWLVTDQAEYILVADRLLERGSLHLAEAGEAPRAALPWVMPPEEGQPQRSRLLPLTSIALVPFAAADRVAASGLPPASRPLVHLQGHVFVLAGLAVIGIALVQSRAAPSSIAVALVLTGLAWPIWQVSRRGGPEPVFVLLVAVFLLGRTRVEGRARGGRTLMSIACALLPWGNPTGPILSAALLAGACAEQIWTGGDTRRLVVPFASALVSTVSLVLLWNVGYHEHWWLGGYAAYHSAAGSVVDPRSLLDGAWRHITATAKEAGLLIAVAGAGALAGRRREGAALLVPVGLVAAMLVMFAAFPHPEPTRRLAAAWPAWGYCAGRTMQNLAAGPTARQGVIALAAVIGFYGFWTTEGRYFAGPGGLFYPSVLWVRLWIESAPAWQFLVPAAVLLAIMAVAASHTSRLIAFDGPAQSG